MRHNEDSEAYWRLAGAITVSIPAIVLLLIGVAYLGLHSGSMVLWTLFTFSPLIVVAYYLDSIVRFIGRGWLGRRHPVLLVIISWMIMYPVVWILSNYAFSALMGKSAEFVLISIPFLAFLGVIFGFYYYIGYIYTYKFLRWFRRKLSKPEEQRARQKSRRRT